MPSAIQQNSTIRLKSAVCASAAHLLGSMFVALGVAALVFLVWYPWPSYELVRGRELFWVVIGVDVVCGPLLTLVLWSPYKPRREIALDFGLIVLIQFTALGYGLYTVAQARPVRLAFEVDRFRMVMASEVVFEDLHHAPPQLRQLPWKGPMLVGIRESRSGDETLLSIELSLAGQEPSLRPSWWQSYEESRPIVQQRMRSLLALRAVRSPQEQAVLDAAAWRAGRPLEDIHYLPLVTYKSLDQWIVLLDTDANIIGYAQVGGFDT